MDRIREDIVIITALYPYKGGEQFLYSEFEELSKRYKRVIIFPIGCGVDQVETGKNVIISYALSGASESLASTGNSILFKNFFLVIGFLMREFFRNDNRLIQIKRLKYTLAFLKQNLSRYEFFKSELRKYDVKSSADYYSTWMNEGALLLSIARKKRLINGFIFRVNGYDIFDERRKEGYMPFQAVNSFFTDRIVVLSNAGLEYLKKKGIPISLLSQNYSGVKDFGIEHQKSSDGVLRIVSCSGLIPLKRVDLLARSLHNIPFAVEWTHFGGGPDYELVDSLTKELPDHVQVFMKGNVEHNEIFNHYQQEKVDAFVHLSETEGLGMAMIEAQSFGVPVIACNVGGIPEIVSDETGILLSPDLSEKDVVSALTELKHQLDNGKNFSEKAKKHFKENFEVKLNVDKLIREF